MTKYLITGGAGFIGLNFILYLLDKYENIEIVNLDKLTYAGNLENLKSIEENPRYTFVKGDICDNDLVSELFAKYDFDYVVNFAAESHVDRSITGPEAFAKTNVLKSELNDEAIGYDLIEHVTDRLGHDRRYGIDPSKIYNELGWMPETDFDDGIRQTIRWYVENSEWLENIMNR